MEHSESSSSSSETSTPESEDIDMTNSFQTKGKSIHFEIKANKLSFQVEFGSDNTGLELKKYIEIASGLPVANQKILFKGQIKDDKTLAENGIKDGSKLMCIGSLPSSIAESNKKAREEAIDLERRLALEAKEKAEAPWCKQTKHMNVIKRGLPDNATPAIKGVHLPLPPDRQIQNMLSSNGEKIRIRFSSFEGVMIMYSDTRSIVTPYSKFTSVTAQEIAGYDNYFIMGFKYGPTEKHVMYIYFVPGQYVDAIKEEVMGK